MDTSPDSNRQEEANFLQFRNRGEESTAVHAKRLRSYHARVGHAGVVCDEDGIYGEVEYATQKRSPAVDDLEFQEIKVAHLES